MQTQNKTFESVLQRALSFIKEKKLFAEGERVLCALSGGADSVALLLILNELSASLRIKVLAAHLNHGIRGDEALRDEQFCIDLCKKLGIEAFVERADVPSEAKRLGKGLEETAREIRYAFLEKTANANSCTKICTAHHADDNIETVLMHLIRGSGLNGLTGISPIRDKIVRPLLTLSKAELEAAVLEKGFDFVHDSTNDGDDCTRNYIRHNILLHIYKLNNSADKAFARMCTSLAADNEYLEGVANSLPEKMSRKELADLHGAILARYVKRRFEDCTGGKGLDAEAVAQIVEAIKDGKTVKYSVPCDLLAFISDSGLEFCTKNATRQELDSPLEWGENIISPIGYRIFITNDTESVNSFTKIYKPSILMKVKSDKITDGERLLARVRTRKTGDRYSYGKMHRDVRRQLISHKIPVQGRDRLPVLYTENDGIFLVTGLPLADGYNAKNGEKAVYIAISEM